MVASALWKRVERFDSYIWHHWIMDGLESFIIDWMYDNVTNVQVVGIIQPIKDANCN